MSDCECAVNKLQYNNPLDEYLGSLTPVLITLAMFFVFKQVASLLGSSPTLINFALMMLGFAWGWSTAMPVVSDVGQYVFGKSNYLTFVKACKCYHKNTSCKKPEPYNTLTQWYIYIAAQVSMVLGGVLIVFELPVLKSLKFTPVGIIRMVVVMILGTLGVVPKHWITMTLMLVTGICINIHFWSMSANCEDLLELKDDTYHNILRQGTPLIALLAPFISSMIMILFKETKNHKNELNTSWNTEDHDLNHYLEKVANNKMNTKYKRDTIKINRLKKEKFRKNPPPSPLSPPPLRANIGGAFVEG